MKKLISYLVIIAMLFANTAFAFSDISSDFDWAKNAIENLSDKGIINGYPDGHFLPSNQVSRAEVAKIVVSAFGDARSISYKDVLPEDWFYPFVSVSGGLFPFSENFHPNEAATRETVAYAIYNSLKLTRKNTVIEFSDREEISYGLGNAIEIVAQYGIIEGYPDKTFKPKNLITRAEVANIINKALTYTTIEEPTPTPTISPEPSQIPSPTTTGAKANNYFFLVKKVSQALNAAGDPVTKVYGYNEGIEETIEIGDVEIASFKVVSPATTEIKNNDIISFSRDYFGKVRYAQIIFRPNTEIKQIDVQILKYSSSNMGVVYGYVSDKYKDIAVDLKIKLTDTTSKLYPISQDANVYILKYNKIERGDISDIIDNKYGTVSKPLGDRILAYYSDEELKEILVIKE
jgi:hypothetical protein